MFHSKKEWNIYGTYMCQQQRRVGFFLSTFRLFYGPATSYGALFHIWPGNSTFAKKYK